MRTSLINLLLKLKNASIAQKETIKIVPNKICEKLLKKLYLEGFIQSFKEIKNPISNKKEILVSLRYFSNKNIFNNLHLISTPSKVKYITYVDLCKINEIKLTLFLSTTRGFITNLECKKYKLGGKVLFAC